MSNKTIHNCSNYEKPCPYCTIDSLRSELEQAEAKLKAVMPVVEAATEYSRAFYSDSGKRLSRARMSLLEAVDNYFAEHINAFTKGESDE